MRFCRLGLFKYIGSPAQFRGSGDAISASFVLTYTVGGEPMKVHCIPGYISALYLIEYPKKEKMLLLDTGFPSDLERIRFYVEEVMNSDKVGKQRMEDKIQLAVCTHSHVDHAGASIGYERCGIPVAHPLNINEYYKGMKSSFRQLVEISLTFFAAGRLGRKKHENAFLFSKGLLGPYWQMPSKGPKLDDGTPLPYGFDDWVAIRCPGHTSHMICLYHPHSQLFYISDMFVQTKKGFFPPFTVDSTLAYNRSLHRLRGLPVRCALLAHFGIIDVDDKCGSWNGLIDDVVYNFTSPTSNGSHFSTISSMKKMVHTFTSEKVSPDVIIPSNSFPFKVEDGTDLPPLYIMNK
ncbi:metallo-beta-lactamase superfamily [Trypanosoma theileri]|uniref:Metallo-beta-lactamase superfamily n=1 Tax=Trypanosoma theileri TaxID=67003 RepID=A0A1X0P270_9TRYP|nr:metallo-beta-lactamase superfamily [Trypanosoma theileri]ORC90995.1 metallo-beta-lactamase superfamily [Trypanosoma theileri]